jgi:type I restriction enzyme S subunit
MANNGWREVSLREAGVVLYDCDHRTPPPAPRGYPYIAIPQMRDGRLDLSGARNISEDDWIEWTKRIRPLPGDVIVSRRCNPGESAVVPKRLDCALGQNLLILRSESPEVDQDFLRWLVRGPEWWAQVQAHLNVGAVFDSLKCEEIPNFRLSVPTLGEQRAIASILGSLDRKIELNRRMNQTLEQMAQALFKSWFVDFDPVRAKGEGGWKKNESPPGMPNTWDLWPSEFEDSEIGEIPKGWKLAGLGEVADCPRELVDPREIDPEEKYVGLEHIAPRTLSLWRWGRVGDTVSGKTRFRRGDVLFGKLRPYFHKVCIPSFDGVASTDILTLRPSAPSWFAFVLGHLNTSQLVDYATATSNGTKMPRTSWGDLARWQVVLPPEEVAKSLARATAPMISKMGQSIEESIGLSTMRDALLPKLLSGEIRVSLNGGA